jgi:hypothetical protein
VADPTQDEFGDASLVAKEEERGDPGDLELVSARCPVLLVARGHGIEADVEAHRQPHLLHRPQERLPVLGAQGRQTDLLVLPAQIHAPVAHVSAPQRLGTARLNVPERQAAERDQAINVGVAELSLEIVIGTYTVEAESWVKVKECRRVKP